MAYDQWVVVKVKTISPQAHGERIEYDSREVLEVVSKVYDKSLKAYRICSRGINSGKWRSEPKKMEDGRFEIVGYDVVEYDSRLDVAGLMSGGKLFRRIVQGPVGRYKYEECLTK